MALKRLILSVDYELIRNIAQTFQALVTSFGIIIAGFWFIKKRQQFPRGNLTHKIIYKELDKNTINLFFE